MLVHLGNFFVGAGPYFSRDLYTPRTSKLTTVALGTVLGGWF